MIRLTNAGLLLASITLAVAAQAGYSSETFLIIGQVRYDDGRPVAGAQVVAQSGAGSAGRLPVTMSGPDGRFELRVQHLGTYRIYASKESEMYPDGYWAMYSTGIDIQPEAVVTGGGPIDVGVVPLGPRGARVVGCVVDADGGEPIPNANLTVRAVHNHEIYFSTGMNLGQQPGCFRLVVPSTRVLLEVSAPGYETWYYGPDGSQRHADALELQPGTTLRRAIQLTAATGR